MKKYLILSLFALACNGNVSEEPATETVNTVNEPATCAWMVDCTPDAVAPDREDTSSGCEVLPIPPCAEAMPPTGVTCEAHDAWDSRILYCSTGS